MATPSQPPDFSGWRVRELRRYLAERGIDTQGALERGELVALAEAAAAGAAASQTAAAADVPMAPFPLPAARPSMARVSFADGFLQAVRETAGDRPNVIAALERAVADPAQRAHIEALGRDLARQPLSQHFVPVEIRPGVAGYMPTYHTYQRFEDLVRSVLHPTAPTEVGTETVAGSDGSSSGSRSSTSSGSCGSCGGRGSGGSGRDRAGSSSAGAAGTPAESIARGSAAAPAATVKRCVVCGTAAEPGGKLKRCGGCHNVLYCGVPCQSRHWRSGHREECGRLRQGST